MPRARAPPIKRMLSNPFLSEIIRPRNKLEPQRWCLCSSDAICRRRHLSATPSHQHRLRDSSLPYACCSVEFFQYLSCVNLGWYCVDFERTQWIPMAMVWYTKWFTIDRSPCALPLGTYVCTLSPFGWLALVPRSVCSCVCWSFWIRPTTCSHGVCSLLMLLLRTASVVPVGLLPQPQVLTSVYQTHR